MSTFIRKMSQVDTKKCNQKKIQNDSYLRRKKILSNPILYGLLGT
jgi:hypothetical protein